MIKPVFWKGKTVFLTGHTGFKGSWLLLWLLELGANVYGYSLPAAAKPNLFREIYPLLSDRFIHIEADLADYDTLKSSIHKIQPDIVLHLAAQSLVHQGYKDPIVTFQTNTLGSVYILEALKDLKKPCSVVMVTTDKVYQNNDWSYGYRETDQLGGHDPYSASKAAAEIAISSWRSSFCGESFLHQTKHLNIATARSGNVIGGGDWSKSRIIPDAIRALQSDQPVVLRNPNSTRPWQHVLEPLSGYLYLAEILYSDPTPPCNSFNFGPHFSSNRTVHELIEAVLSHWPGQYQISTDLPSYHEANILKLNCDKAFVELSWLPTWDFQATISRTVNWYLSVHRGVDPLQCMHKDITDFSTSLSHDF